MVRALSAMWLLVAIGAPLRAQTAAAAPSDRISQLESLANRCKVNQKDCQEKEVGPDEQTKLPNGVRTTISYEWMRAELKEEANDKDDDDRADAMDAVVKRLHTTPASYAPASANARPAANAILHQVEFAEAQPSWLNRTWNAILRWVFTHLHLGDPGEGAKNIGRVIVEVLMFLAPVTLLGVWLLRQIREDRLVPRFAGARGRERQAKEIDWELEAQQCAARGEWREAIHALYWSTIVLFEERKVWSATRARTPREYLALLEAGSARRRLLRELNALLESSWYGHRETTGSDFQRAAQLTEELARG